MLKIFGLFLLSLVLVGCVTGMGSKSACQIKGQGFCAPMSAIESWDETGALSPAPVLLKGADHVQ